MPRTQGRDPRLRLYAFGFDGGSGRAHRLAAGAGAIGQGGLRQGHDERRRNACFRVGLERVHGLDAGGGACFRQSRAGTARANITHIIELGYWLYCALKFEYELCHSPQLARPAGYLLALNNTIAAVCLLAGRAADIGNLVGGHHHQPVEKG